MKVHFCGYGYINDRRLIHSDDLDKIFHIQDMSYALYHADKNSRFVLPHHVFEELSIFGSVKVEYFLYEHEHAPLHIDGYGMIESKFAAFYMAKKGRDDSGRLVDCPMEINNRDDMFVNQETGNKIKLFPEEKSMIKPSYTHASELMKIMDEAVVEFWENHDSKNPPTSVAIKQWLKENNENLSEREARAIDSIMRPLRYK